MEKSIPFSYEFVELLICYLEKFFRTQEKCLIMVQKI